MTDTASPFTITMLPSDAPCRTSGFRVSLCIEINRAFAHDSALLGSDFRSWYGRIRSLHEGTSSQYKALRQVVERAGNFQIDGHAQPPAICLSPWPVPETAVKLWLDVVNADPEKTVRRPTKRTDARAGTDPPIVKMPGKSIVDVDK